MRPCSLTVDGISMHWLEEGSGEPVIFIHGFLTNPRLWRQVIPLLPGLRCLCWEMVGYGQSIPQGRDRDISVRAQAEYLYRWMQSVGIGRATLVGHDMGGGVAQVLATRHPECCLGLVLIDSVCYDNWPTTGELALAAMPGLEQMPVSMLEMIAGSHIYRGHDSSEVAHESLEIHWGPYAQHGAGPALARQLRTSSNRDTLEIAGDLKHLRLPCRVVWGTDDPFLSVRSGDRLSRDLNCPFWRINNARHYTPEDHPEVIADAIDEVLRDQESGGRDRMMAEAFNARIVREFWPRTEAVPGGGAGRLAGMMPCNVGSTEQMVRIGVGLAAGAAAMTAPRRWRLPLGILSAIGLATGLTRFCPANALLGINTCQAPQGRGREAEQARWDRLRRRAFVSEAASEAEATVREAFEAP